MVSNIFPITIRIPVVMPQKGILGKLLVPILFSQIIYHPLIYNQQPYWQRSHWYLIFITCSDNAIIHQVEDVTSQMLKFHLFYAPQPKLRANNTLSISCQAYSYWNLSFLQSSTTYTPITKSIFCPQKKKVQKQAHFKMWH